jgi:hypothetical protein
MFILLCYGQRPFCVATYLLYIPSEICLRATSSYLYRHAADLLSLHVKNAVNRSISVKSSQIIA